MKKAPLMLGAGLCCLGLLLAAAATAAEPPAVDDEPDQPPAPAPTGGPVNTTTTPLGTWFGWHEVSDERLPAEVAAAARELVRDVLDPLRAALGRPLVVTSWWRSPADNAAIKGASRTSDHLTGRAVDLRPPDGMTSTDVARKVLELGLPFDQLIGYGDSRHLHVGYRGASSRRQALWYPTHGAASRRWALEVA